jgi:hypothetical protein
MAAAAAGIDYTSLVNKIASLAVERFAARTKPIVGDERAPVFAS